MIKVYIWEESRDKKDLGHASMLCDGTYISLWPPSDIHDSRDDTIAMGGRMPNTIMIWTGLYETKIKRWWERRPNIDWDGINRSSAFAFVASVLKKGGSDQLVHLPKEEWTSSSLERYVCMINSRIKEQMNLPNINRTLTTPNTIGKRIKSF